MRTTKRGYSIEICCFLWGIKFIPEEESDHDSEEEPELEQCHIERQISEKTSQPIVSTDMTLLVQSNLEHGQDNLSSDLEHIDTPVNHVDLIDKQQGSMAPPTAFSSDQLIDPHVTGPKIFSSH